MTLPFNLWLANLLGIYVGWVIVLETVLVLAGIALFLVGMAHLVVEIRYKYDESEGIEAFGWLLLLAIPSLILLLLHWIAALAVIATIAGLYNSGDGRHHRRW